MTAQLDGMIKVDEVYQVDSGGVRGAMRLLCDGQAEKGRFQIAGSDKVFA
jgi:hypothetical protein